MDPVPVVMDNLSKRFGATRALCGLSVRIDRGAVFAMLGPNGAGKTTTLRMLLGLVRPDAGSVQVFGLDPAREGRRVREQIGVLLENDGLYERLSALRNLEFHGKIQRVERKLRRQRAEELLSTFGLWERRNELVARWSTGMRKKLAIARALLHSPRLLLLDEPFSGLDPTAAAELRGTLLGLAQEKSLTVLLTTHDLSHVEKIGSQIAVINQGRVIAEGTPAALTQQRGNLETHVKGAGIDAALLSAMQADGQIVSFRLPDPGHEEEGAVVVCTRESRAGLGQALAGRGVVVDELRTLQGSLEDAFLALFSGKKGQS